MNNILTLILLLYLLLTIEKAHSQEVFMTEMSPLHFGDIYASIGALCSIDRFANLQGECNASNPDVSIGYFELTGFPKNTDFFLTVTGSQNNQLSYISSSIGSVRGNESLLLDGAPVSFRMRGQRDTILLEVFGSIEVLAPLQSQITYQTPYTIDITFQ